MNGPKCREILDNNLLQSAQDLRLGKRFTFQQDNNPKHTAKTMQKWLRDKSLNGGIVCKLMWKKTFEYILE